MQENDTSVFFIDEGELYYHPEWQRLYINTLVDIIKECGKNIQIQIIITSNSPFIISDMIEEDIMYLPRDNDNLNSLTFGQNIHKLLKRNFFMKYTIGEFARNRIDLIIGWLNELEQLNIRSFDEERGKILNKITKEIEIEFGIKIDNKELYQYLKLLIEQIGEDIYREKLTKLLDDCFCTSHEFELELLERKKSELEEQISRLKEKSR